MTRPSLTHAFALPLSLSTSLLVTLLVGCNTANTIRVNGPANADGTIPYRQIINNSWLHSKANVVAVREATVNGDMMRVAVDVYSDQNSTKRFSYRFDWLDAASMPVASATNSLTSVTINPKETITLTAVAPSPAATQWRLTFLDQNG